MRILSPVSTEFTWQHRAPTPSVFSSVFTDFDRIVEAALTPSQDDHTSFHVNCDAHETKDHYLLTLDVPGVKKEEIKIELRGNKLLISGQRQPEVRNQDRSMAIRTERAHGKFERSFTLPSTVTADKIEAHFDNGVLNIIVPKAQAALDRTIQIQSGQEGFLSKLLQPEEARL